MKINVLQKLVNFNDELIKDERGKEITLRDVLTNSLLSSTEKSKNDTGEIKYDKYRIAGLVNGADNPKLDINDLKKLKDYVGYAYSPLIVGVVWDILEGKDKKDEEEEIVEDEIVEENDEVADLNEP